MCALLASHAPAGYCVTLQRAVRGLWGPAAGSCQGRCHCSRCSTGCPAAASGPPCANRCCAVACTGRGQAVQRAAAGRAAVGAAAQCRWVPGLRPDPAGRGTRRPHLLPVSQPLRDRSQGGLVRCFDSEISSWQPAGRGHRQPHLLICPPPKHNQKPQLVGWCMLHYLCTQGLGMQCCMSRHLIYCG
jgi:hypothetical protein